jgi:hypothetical protein
MIANLSQIAKYDTPGKGTGKVAIMSMGAVVYTSRVTEQPSLEAEQSIKDVRNRLAPIIEAVRYFDRVIFMTNRKVRVAAVVPFELGELADEMGGPKALIEFVRSARAGES